MKLQLFAMERQEPPTAKRRREAREQGQAPQSRDLTAALGTIAFVVLWMTLAGSFIATLGRLVQGSLQAPLVQWNPQDVLDVVWRDGLFLVQAVGPLLAIGFLLSLLLPWSQTGFLFAASSLTQGIRHLNPLQNAKRLGSRQSLGELAKSLAKVGLGLGLGLALLTGAMSTIIGLPFWTLSGALAWTLAFLEHVGLFLAMGLVVLGVLDFWMVRRRFSQSLKMSREEVKRESREQDGAPEVKQHIRRLQHRFARMRMMSAIQKATVVVTNPTHFAVALHYDMARTAAPVVVAKGLDALALRIKRAAELHHVPIVEQAPLARALYRKVEIGQSIPHELYQAVAEILAWLMGESTGGAGRRT